MSVINNGYANSNTGGYVPNTYVPSAYPQRYPNLQYVYQPTQPQTIPMMGGSYGQPQGIAPSDNGINWVQGEAGAKGYPVAPGKSVLLMDSESEVFYIKAVDASGVPLPLEIFDYKKRIQTENVAPPLNNDEQKEEQLYVTREEFEKRLAELQEKKSPASTKKGVKK